MLCLQRTLQQQLLQVIPLGLLLFFVKNVSHSGIILTSDANWLITIETMTTTNKVEAMVSGDLFINVYMYI